MNSYRFKSSSLSKNRTWSPDINYEDRFKKKRKREDFYIASFAPKDRPVLLIKKKHAYVGVKNSEVFEDPKEKESYYKISENTQKIDNMTDEINSQEVFIKRATVMHPFKNKNKKPVDEEKDNSIYKIEGLEFLPEGFLELDPLLYKDEYSFENKVHEEVFTNEQRKLKALRRKQYTQKKYQKMRDVTIYVLNEHKDRIVTFLEKWYFKHKRRMNEEEIIHVADLLKCDRETMRTLQELFLKKQRILNVKKLRQYLMKNGRIIDNKLTVPISLRKYFIKTSDPYSHVKPRVYNTKKEYQPKYPYFKTKKLRKSFSTTLARNPYKDKFNSKVYDKNNNNYNKTQQLNNGRNAKGRDSNNTRDFNGRETNGRNSKNNKDLNGGNFENDINVNRGVFSPSPDVNMRNSSPNYIKSKNDNDLNKYFEKEMNKIFTNLRNDGSGVYNGSTNDEMKNSTFSKKPKSDHSLEKIADENLYKDEEVERYPEMDTFGGEQKKPNPKILHSEVDEEFKNRLAKKPTFDNNTLPARVTIAATTKKGDTYVIQKLGPIIVGTQYYYQEIEDITKKNGERSVSLITKNDMGIIVDKKILEEEEMGDNYTNEMLIDKEEFDGDNKSIIIINNDKGNAVSINTVRPSTLTNLGDENIDEKMKQGNFRKSFVVRDKNSTVHVLQPVNVFGEYYQQIINEALDDYGKKKITIITKNEDGIILAEDEIRADSFANKSYITKIENDYINEDGDREVIIETKDENGETIASHAIRKNLNPFEENAFNKKTDRLRKTTVSTKKDKGLIVRSHTIQPVICGKEFFKQEVEEKVDKKGNRSILVITKNQYGEIVNEESVDEDLMGNAYTSEIVKDTNLSGDRKVSILTKNERGEAICVVNVRPTIYQVLGEDYFNIEDNDLKGKKSVRFKSETNGKSISRKSVAFQRVQGSKTIISHALRPTVIGNEFYQQIIDEIIEDGEVVKANLITKNPVGETVSIVEVDPAKIVGEGFETDIQPNRGNNFTIITKNENGQVLAIQDLRPTINTVIGENYYDDFDNISKGRNSFSSVIRKKNGTKIRSTTLRPTKIGEDFYQQIIDEVIEGGRVLEARLTTKDAKGEVISVVEIDPKKVKGEDFDVETKQLKSGSIKIITKNENEEIVGVQRIRPTINNVLGEDYFADFEEISRGKKSVINVTKNKGKKIKSTIMRPTQIGGEFYQQLVNEIIEEDGKKSVMLITKKENGDIVTIEELSDLTKSKSIILPELIEEKGEKQRGVTIVIRDEEGKQLEKRKVSIIPEVDEGEEDDDIEISNNFRGRTLSQKSVITNRKGTKKVNHVLRPTIIGDKYYNQLVEETIDKFGNRKITLITKDANNNIIDTKEIDVKNVGENYQTQIINDYIDPEGIRKVTLEVKNDRGQSIAIIKVRPTILEVIGENYFDDEKIDHLKDNEIELKRSGSMVSKVKKLPAMMIGTRKYLFYFLEKMDKNGNQTLTFVAENQNNEKIFSYKLNPKFISETYKGEIIDDITNDKRTALVRFINAEGKVITEKKFKTGFANNINDFNFTDFHDIFDDNKVRKSTIAVRKDNRRTFKSHSIRPTLIGAQYYTQTVNEIFDQQKGRKATVVTTDQNGKIISIEEIDPNLMGETYETKIINEKNDKEGLRVVRVETVNNRGETVCSQVIRPTVMGLIGENYFDLENVIEEVVDKDGNRKITVIQPEENGEIVLKNELLEEDIKEKDERSISFKNNYFEDLLKKYKVESDGKTSFNKKKSKTNRDHSKTFHNLLKKSNKIEENDKEYEIPEREERDLNSSLRKTTTKMQELQKMAGGFDSFDKNKNSNSNPNQNNKYMGKKSYNIRKNFDTLEEGNDHLLEKSNRLKGYLDDYINTLKKSKTQKQMEEEENKKNQERMLRDTIQSVFDKEKDKLGDEIVRKISQQSRFGNSNMDGDIMDEFYEFCKHSLPHDQRYKESIMMVSLFYYFLEKKNLLRD